MKITKYVHSCLLAETPDRVALIDPGQWSWESGLVDVDKFERVDRILITHAHQDHCSTAFIRAILEKFPNAHVITNQEVTKHLQEEGVRATIRSSSECSVPFEAPHEPTPFPGVPQNVGFHFKDKLTHPGDSHSFNETKDVLALPITAPWGSMTAALTLAVKLKPKIVVPVHDWHWSEAGRRWSYDLCEEALGSHGIRFIKTEDGVPFEV